MCALFSPILGPLRGSIGSTVFSHNKGGDYARLRQAPTNPQSARQMAVRNILATLSVGWSELTDAQRANWKAYADDRPRTNPLGGSYTMTGLQAYCALNSVMVDSGGVAGDSPPLIGVQNPGGSGGGTTLVFTTASTITITPASAPPTGGRVVCWWNGPVGSGQDPDLKQAVLVAYSDVDPAGAVVLTLPFAVQDGETAKFWVGNIDAYGQKSELIEFRALYTAV